MQISCLHQLLLFKIYVRIQDYSTGIHASPFSDDLYSLQHLTALHGIPTDGFSIKDCRIVLFRHIFGGHCVSTLPTRRDRTACNHFGRGFQSAEEMSFAAFNILASSKVIQRANEDLLHVFSDLGIQTAFRADHFRRQIISELNIQAKNFVHSQNSVLGSNVFTHFQRHNRATLLAITSAHGISVNRFTSNMDDLKHPIVNHFALGHCFPSLIASKMFAMSLWDV